MRWRPRRDHGCGKGSGRIVDQQIGEDHATASRASLYGLRRASRPESMSGVRIGKLRVRLTLGAGAGTSIQASRPDGSTSVDDAVDIEGPDGCVRHIGTGHGRHGWLVVEQETAARIRVGTGRRRVEVMAATSPPGRPTPQRARVAGERTRSHGPRCARSARRASPAKSPFLSCASR
jgi:hypothetical protein